MSKRRVVVTGLGHVSPVGNDVATGWANLLAGKSGIAKITRFDASDMACQIAGEVKDFNIGDYISPKEARRNDLFIHYGIAAALQAVADAGWTTSRAWTRPESASTSAPASAACR
ncbi:3-oxoacyl-[acyl-carrier-protein] synthase 2 [Chromobacterium violaceum]|uniref:3-oxoacyl-[acyl-carrier-protein] synthase 2 n=1 Tax=Chromobacterium violaceum TaxID=536 RepID=A0A447THU1_CHRVL|nr:3-oxoacyl-[acyl-carrier-protein] synthase 2 [Chromobacterium violaceum]